MELKTHLIYIASRQGEGKLLRSFIIQDEKVKYGLFFIHAMVFTSRLIVTFSLVSRNLYYYFI